MRRLRYENGSLDGIDRRIVRLLVDDARISVANIARRVGLSGPSVSERLRRLEESGTIAGYTVKVNPAALGLPLAAWLRIRPVPGQLAAVIEIVKAIPQVASCDRVTGEDCLIAKVQVASVTALEALIDRIAPYAMTNTAIIQSSPVDARLAVAGDDAIA